MKSNPLRPMSDTGEAHVMAHFKRPALSRVFLFAAAFAASPVPFFGASNIAKTSGSGATITTGSFGTGTKYTITPDQIKGAAAFNDFAKFNLDAGDVANLEFGAASTLVNVIRDSSASEINGQVNAIKNNKIGGKLIFANANGIIVGSSGAIHAGSIVLMTPTKKFLDGIPGTEDSPGVEGVTAENFDVKFSDLVKIPISSSGTITVSGNLFALDGVKIKAQSITVDGAQILTGQAAVTALGQITNLGDTDAGTALVANSDGTVEILAESVLDEDSAFIWASETVKAEVAIKGTTKIEAKDVTIKANAECYMDPLVTTVSVFTGMGAESESKVDIGKDVTIVAKNGGKVDIAANAAAVLTRFGTDDSVGGTVAEWARRGVDQLNLDPSNQLLSFLKQFIDVNVLYLNSDAKANVDFKGTVETLGVDSASVNINSRAKAKNEFDVLEKTKRGVGFMFAKTNAEAGTLIGETAVINPKGMVSIDSLTESDNLVKMQMGLKSEFSVPSVGEKIYGGLPDQLPVNFNVVIVVSDTNSKASTTVASNAQITGTGVSIVSRALDKQDISG